MAVTRLKGVKEFLENCQDAANFSELRQKQFEAMLKELQQLKQISHENGAQMVTSLKSMPWTEEMMSTLLATVHEKVSFASTRVSLQNWNNSLPSRMVFFVGYLSNKLLVPGMAVVLRKPK